MKKIAIFIMLIIISFQTYAQQFKQSVDTTYYAKVKQAFAPLDKSKIPYGILSDYGMELLPLKAFDGTAHDSLSIDYLTFYRIYSSLLLCRIVDNPNDGFVSQDSLDYIFEKTGVKNQIRLSGLLYNYASFKSNAKTANKITYNNGQFFDKYSGGQWQNPYETYQCFAIAPSVNTYSKLDVDVIFRQNMFYTNDSQSKTIEIDFSDGNGFRVINFDTPIHLHYNTPGHKKWKYKLTLQNGDILYSQSIVNFRNKNSNYPTVHITATIPYQNEYGEADIIIDLAPGHTQITNPLIVAEGIDFGTLLDPTEEEGYQTYDIFKNFINNSYSFQLQNLLTDYNRTYDIIYVNWANGVDYIQRNAYVLEEVINYVIQHKQNQNADDITVLGQSMGGVVARFALANMEKRHIPHHTKLFIAHDAPMQGANMPMSIQTLYRDITSLVIINTFGMPINVFPNNYIHLLDQPAVKQLLTTTMLSNPYGFFIPISTIHDNFQIRLKHNGLNGSNGYPTLCRNIAISNGSECGKDQGFNTGARLFSYNGTIEFPELIDLVSPIFSALAIPAFFLVGNGSLFLANLINIIPGHGSFTIDMYGNAMDYTHKIIYRNDTYYTKSILFIFNINIQLLYTTVRMHSPTPRDNYGGGYYSPDSYFEDENGNVQLPSGMFLRDRFSFIQTPSALDIGLDNVQLNDSDYKNSYIGAQPPTAPYNTPFANFVTEFDTSNINAHNKYHTSFDKRNGDWLADELVASNITYTDCSAFCDGATIIGPDIVCDSETYTISGNPNSIYWSISQGNSLVNLDTHYGNTVTLSVNDVNAMGGFVTLNVNINSSECGYISGSKQIWVGKPNVRVNVDYDDIEVYSVTLSILSNNSSSLLEQGVTDIQWNLMRISPNASFYPGNLNSDATAIIPNEGDYVQGTVTITNSCGDITLRFLAINQSNLQINCDDNDVNSHLFIVRVGNNKYMIADVCENTFEDISISELYNQYGVKLQDVLPDSDEKIDISNTQNGQIVILRIITNNGVKSKTVIIE